MLICCQAQSILTHSTYNYYYTELKGKKVWSYMSFKYNY